MRSTRDVIGLRDRELIGLMVYSFARIGAAIGMRVEDVVSQNRRLWVRLPEKGGERHAMPCHRISKLPAEYLDGAGLASEPKALLFQTYSRATGRLTGNPLPQRTPMRWFRARQCGGIRRAWQPHFSRDGHHRLPGERRHAREGRADGEPCQDAHDTALRSEAEEVTLDEVERILV